MKLRDLAGSLILFAFAVSVLIFSLGLGIGTLNNPQAGFMPLVVGSLVLIFSIVLFVMTCRNRSALAGPTGTEARIGWRKSLIVLAALVIYVVVLPLAGFVLSTFVLMLVLFKLNALRFWTAFLGAVVSVLVTYGLFSFLLKTPLPRGIWGF